MEALKIEGLIGTLRSDDGDGNENVKKAIGLDWQNNNLARAHTTHNTLFFVHSFTFTARLRRENA